MPPPTAAAVSLPQLPLRATPARPRSCCHRPPAPCHSWNGGAAGHGPWAAGCGLRAAGCRGVVCRACRAPDGGAGNGMQWVHSRASLRGVAVCPACPPCMHCTLGPGTSTHRIQRILLGSRTVPSNFSQNQAKFPLKLGSCWLGSEVGPVFGSDPMRAGAKP